MEFSIKEIKRCLKAGEVTSPAVVSKLCDRVQELELATSLLIQLVKQQRNKIDEYKEKVQPVLRKIPELKGLLDNLQFIGIGYDQGNGSHG